MSPVARSTARSDSGSAPTTWNGVVVPSENAAFPPVECPTTCAFVSRNPSAVNTTADPSDSPPRFGTRTLATLGVSDSATPATMVE